MSTRDTVAFHDARRRTWEAASDLPVEEIPLGDAVGRMLAHDVIALTEVPHYASSAMDGWAVSGTGPWRLRVPGSDDRLDAGEAFEIVTGGAIPAGADAVLRREHGSVASGAVTASVVPSPGRHIRRAGEESGGGEIVVSAGARLNPAQVAVVAGAGHDTVTVVRAPRIGFVFTGTEVVTSGLPDAGRVRDSFDPMLPAAVGGLGAVIVSRTRIGDDRDALREALSAREVDILVSTGGTADSPVDHVRPVLAALGAGILVDGLAVRPGSPTMLARRADEVLLLALPGNPLAAMTGLLTLLPPVIARMHGTALPPLETVRVGESVPGIPGRTVLTPYRLDDGRAIRCSRTGSGMLRGLAESTGLLVVPEGGLECGARAEMLPLPW